MATRSGKKKEETGVAPHFVQPLKPLIVEENQPATMQCAVAGQPTPAVKWFRSNKEILPDRKTEMVFVPETGVATLRLLEPSDDDQTVYSVKAVNTFGRAECRANLIVSKAVKVTKPLVLRAPKITEPLKAMVISPGHSMTLEASFEGTPTPEVRWYRNGKEILPKSDTKVVTENNKTTLHIPEVFKTDGGKYEVRAMNPVGEARSSGSVAIRAPEPEMSEVIPPRFIEPIQPQIVAEGEVVIMEVRVDSHPTCSFQWFQHSVPIKSSPELRVVSDDNHSVLLVRDVLPEHAGIYTCRAENVGGSVTCTATVNILPETEWEESVELASPTFVTTLASQRVMDGERVEFSCKVVGKPLPKVSWFHKKEPVQEAKDVVFYQDSEGVCKLAISEVFPEDAGEYTCQAVNRVGEAVCAASLVVEAYEYVPDSEIASVTMGTSLVTGQSGSEEDLLAEKEVVWEEKTDVDIKQAEVGNAPYFIAKLPEKITTRDGELTRLEVKAEGVPRPTIRWYKQGTEIVPSSEFQVEHLEDGSSILTITEAFPDDCGEILCEAQNELGLDQTVCLLDVQSIVGTKEYRKPEWVTHMEELQEALRGNIPSGARGVCMSHGDSVSECVRPPDFLLSPIRESSEPSSASSGSLRLLSASCEALGPTDASMASQPRTKYLTFPRSKMAGLSPVRTNACYSQREDPAMYPLEPRELDIENFQQLHQADSQEELQEFLLLESQCMTTDHRRGLAAGFVPDSDDSDQ